MEQIELKLFLNTIIMVHFCSNVIHVSFIIQYFFELALGEMDTYDHISHFFTQGIRFRGQKYWKISGSWRALALNEHFYFFLPFLPFFCLCKMPNWMKGEIWWIETLIYILIDHLKILEWTIWLFGPVSSIKW